MRTIKFRFRWNVKQVDANTVEMPITGGSCPILNAEWIQREKLSDEEIDDASIAVIEKLAGPKVVKD